MLAVNWDAIGSIASVASVAIVLIGYLVKVGPRLVKAQESIDTVNRRVTTPESVTGTIGEEVATIANRSALHEAQDDARFKKLWNEVGREEPK